MASNLTWRLNAVGQVLISRNRRLSQPWRWGRALVAAVVLATAGVMFTSLFYAWNDLQYLNLSYQISQGQEAQKQYLDLNRKLKIELVNLTAISRLERLAAAHNMGSPQPSQVITLP
jgi:hypothetical protein